MMDFGEITRSGRRTRRRWLLLGPFVVLLAVLLGTGVVVRAVPSPEEGAVGKGEKEELQRLASSSRDSVDVLLMGVDQKREGAARADTMMLARVEPETGEVSLLSIPRDFLVEIAPGREARINAAYARGGPRRSVAVVEDLTGVDVDHYAVADFEGFRKLVDAMGGVEVDLEGNIPREWGDEADVRKLDGRQALFYARYRRTEDGDLDRIRRQRELLSALRGQAFDWSSVRELPEVAGIAREHLETDMSTREMVSLGGTATQSGDGAVVTSGQLEGEPVTLASGKQVLIPDREANAEILQEYRE